MGKWDTPLDVAMLQEPADEGVKMLMILPSKDEIPTEFWGSQSGWSKMAGRWFHHGLPDVQFAPKQGITVLAALAHLRMIMHSHQPTHGHKLAGVAYLMSLWFDHARDSRHGEVIAP